MSNPQATPQADGDSRPFDLGTMPQDGGPFWLVTEKRGPAFDELWNKAQASDSPTDGVLKQQLESSIASHALKTAGEVLNALQRRCLLDVCASWPRLLKVTGVTSRGARRYPRQAWEWQEMKEAVEMALRYAEQPESLKWQEADATLRGYALVAAEATESQIGNGDHFLMLTHNAATYRAFAEGRDA